MSIVKLVAGIILFAAGVLLGMAVIFSLTRLNVDFSDAYGIGYFTGGALMALVFTVISFFMMKYGVRLTRKKN